MSIDTNPGQGSQDGAAIQTTLHADASTLVENLGFTPGEAEVAEVISPGLGALAEAIEKRRGEVGCIYFSGSVREGDVVVIDVPQG